MPTPVERLESGSFEGEVVATIAVVAPVTVTVPALHCPASSAEPPMLPVVPVSTDEIPVQVASVPEFEQTGVLDAEANESTVT